MNGTSSATLDFDQIETQMAERFTSTRTDSEDDKSSSRHAEVVRIVVREWEQRICPELRRGQPDNQTAAQYGKLCWTALALIDDVYQALHSLGASEKLAPAFWSHQTLDLLRLHQRYRGFYIDEPDLSEIAARYLNHPELRTNRMDWLLLEGLIFGRLEALASEITSVVSGIGASMAAAIAQGSHAKYICWRVLFYVTGVSLAYVAPLVIAYYLAVNDYRVAAAVVFGLFALSLGWAAVTFPFRLKTKRRARTLLAKLDLAYRLLGDRTIYPRGLKEAIDAAAASGATIDGAVYSIIDRMLARDATAFIP